MKHSHWSFKANTETFDGRRAVREAWAAGMQAVVFESGKYVAAFATRAFADTLDINDLLTACDYADDGDVFLPSLEVFGVTYESVPAEDLPPYTAALLEVDADKLREIVGKLKKMQRVAVSGYGGETEAVSGAIFPIVVGREYFRRNGSRAKCTRLNGSLAFFDPGTDVYFSNGRASRAITLPDDIVAEAPPTSDFVCQGPGMYQKRDGNTVAVVLTTRGHRRVYPYSSNTETYGECGQIYAKRDLGGQTPSDLVSGKIAEL